MANNPPCILTIDDEDGVRNSIRMFLEDYDYDVYDTNNGHKGLKLFAEINPDLVLVDLRMPILDGLDVLREITKVSPETPVIVVSGTGVISDVVEALHIGAWDYLLKPIEDLMVLKHAVSRAIERSRLMSENKSYHRELEDKVKLRTAQLEQAKLEAEKANRAKSAFLANMSHEIRTPLNAVIGYNELLAELVEDEEQKQYLANIHKSSKNLLTLLNDILDLSRIEANIITLNFTETDIDDVFKDIINIFSIEAAKKNLKWIVEFEDHLPHTLILDAARIRQVLLNLIGNAIKFTEKGHIRLSITHRKSTETTIDLIINIEDTGIGINDEQLESIFDEFTQQENQNVKYGGAGLGLSISKRLAKMMNGNISLQSHIGHGSLFVLTLKDVTTCY